MNDDFDYTKPPKNVLDLPDLCPSCGGIGFTRGPGGQYDYRDCPNKLCNNGKLTLSQENYDGAVAAIKALGKRDMQVEGEISKRFGMYHMKVHTIAMEMYNPL